ncbi:hypothetical protein LEN26_007348 [Aphanomyces euteiches]|nr:hypothetical protein LEN26_007348 [Aphanomyces euteiches]
MLVAAKRNCKNRAKGTIEMMPENVDSVNYIRMILENVVPAIRAKIPPHYGRNTILLQQDNAGPHRPLTTNLLRSHGVSNIEVTNQPPNSPDYNVLDLGYFNSIQSLQQKSAVRIFQA